MAFSVNYIYRIKDLYSSKLAKIRKQTDKYRKSTKKAAKATKKFSDKMSNMQSAIGSVAGVIGGAALVGNFVRFDEMMNVARGTTRSTEEEFEKLRLKAKDLGSTTEFSASQAAAGIEMLGRNGLKATQIMGGAIDATLLLASATGADLATSANIATDVMANFNKKAGDLGTIVDRISGVTLTSKFNINDYALALGQAGGVAGELGVTLGGFNTTISATAPLFKSGAGAGTSFKTFLQRLVPISKESAKEMRKLGLITKDGSNAFFDSSGKMKSMSEISGMLNKSLGQLTDKQKASAVKTIFGNDAMRTALGLSKLTADQFKKLSGEIEKVSAQKLAEDRLRGLGGALKIVRSTIEAANIAIFDSGLALFLTKVSNKLAGFLVKVAETNPWILRIVGALGLMVVVAGPLLMMLGFMASGVSALLAVVGAITAPILIWVAAGVLLVAGLTAMYNKSAMLRQSISNLGKSLKPLGAALKTIALLVGAEIGAAFGVASNDVKTFADIASVAINGVAAIITGVFGLVKGLAEAFASLTLGEGMGKAFSVFKRNLGYGDSGATGGGISAENAKATSGTLNGNISVSAGPGSVINRTKMSTDFPGNLGMNMAASHG